MLLILSTPCPRDASYRFVKIMPSLEVTQDLLAQDGRFVDPTGLVPNAGNEETTGQWSKLVKRTVRRAR